MVNRASAGGVLAVEVAEKVVQGLLDLHVHIDRDVNRLHLDGLGLDAQAPDESERRRQGHGDEALHEAKHCAFGPA